MKYIPLTQNKYAVVDDNDFEYLNKYKWYYDNAGYARRNDYSNGRHNPKAILMHRLLINAPKNLEVDHINGNPLDNRRTNLRLVTDIQQAWNRKKKSGKTTSMYRGVSLSKNGKKWQARIQNEWIGTFDTEFEAYEAYKRRAIELFGIYFRAGSI